MDLVELVRTVEWSEPSTFDQTGVHHGYRRNRHHLPEWVEQVAGPSVNVWISHIDPGGLILPHRDAGPYRRRVQIPVVPSGYMWTEVGGWEHHTEPFDVPHWAPHAVVNPGPGPRIHLVADLVEQVGADDTQDFRLFEWPDDMPQDVAKTIGVPVG